MDTINSAYTLQPDFIRACKLANTEPTKRQASRFRSGKGRAYKVARKVENAPPVPSWFEPVMSQDCPPEFLYLPEIPKEAETEDEAKSRAERDAAGAAEMNSRNREISEWKTRRANQAIEQWPKAWALKTLGL